MQKTLLLPAAGERASPSLGGTEERCSEVSPQALPIRVYIKFLVTDPPVEPVTPKPIENPSPVGSPCWGPRAGTRSGQQVRGGAWTSVKKAGDASSHSFPGASKGPNPLQDPKFHDSPRPPAWLALALALWGRVCSARAGTAPTATRGAGGSRRGHRSELAGRTACPWSRQGSAQGAPRSGHVLYGRPLTCRLGDSAPTSRGGQHPRAPPGAGRGRPALNASLRDRD